MTFKDLDWSETEFKTWDGFVKAWNAVPDSSSEFPRFVKLAWDGCFELLGFDIGVCSKEEFDSILLAALDAESLGDEEAKAAAAERLQSLAVANGWEEYL